MGQQSHQGELKVKARLLLEKAQRESVDQKNVEQRSDNAGHHHQQQVLGSADSSTTTHSTDTVPSTTGVYLIYVVSSWVEPDIISNMLYRYW